ncbi:MAG: Ig-like domain-containing protein, partial [Pseudoxanthomonas sp.]
RSEQADSMGLHGELLKHRQAGGPGLAVDWKETNNYYPFAVGLMPKAGDADYDAKYVRALRLFGDRDQYPLFPFYTANQADLRARGAQGSNNFSVINSTVMFRLLAEALRDYPSPYLDAQAYRKLLYWNAWAHYIDGDNRYPDQNEFWAQGSAEDGGRIGYRSWIHHTQLGATNFTVIEDAMGLRPRDDAKIELYPIDIGWDHFAADGIRYRDHDLSIVWDRDGRGYGGRVPAGYSLYLDGKLAFTVDRLAHLVYDPAAGTVEPAPDAINHGDVHVLAAHRAALARPEQVVFAPGARVGAVMVDAGLDVSLPARARDLALGAQASASHAAPDFGAAGAVDGSTANEPFWGTAGSPAASDWIELDLGRPQWLDAAVLYFYRSSAPAGEAHGFASGTRAGYAPPWSYWLEYFDGSGWKRVPGQTRAPAIAQGDRNALRFPALVARRLRLVVLHAGALRTGLKEIQLYDRGGMSPRAVGNQPPQVVAWQEDRAGAVRLQGVVGDDGLPDGRLSLHWSRLDGPQGGEAIFDTADATTTTVRFTAPGRYRLQLLADDGSAQARAAVVVDAPALEQGAQVQGEATASAQQTATHHRVEALNDGALPARGEPPAADRRWGSWGRARPDTVWLQYDWPQPRRIAASALYFWDDAPQGAVRRPRAWKLQYLHDGTWTDIAARDGYPVAGAGEASRAAFAPVLTTALRAVLETAMLEDGRAALGVDEWQVFADRPSWIEPFDLRIAPGQAPALPATLAARYADGGQGEVGVRWPPLDPARIAGDGRVDLHGLADGGVPVTATLWVRASAPGQVNTVDAPAELVVAAGQVPVLPAFATVQYNDGSRERRPVRWRAPPGAAPAPGATLTVEGTVQGRDATGTLPLRIVVRTREAGQ